MYSERRAAAPGASRSRRHAGQEASGSALRPLGVTIGDDRSAPMRGAAIRQRGPAEERRRSGVSGEVQARRRDGPGRSASNRSAGEAAITALASLGSVAVPADARSGLRSDRWTSAGGSAAGRVGGTRRWRRRQVASGRGAGQVAWRARRCRPTLLRTVRRRSCRREAWLEGGSCESSRACNDHTASVRGARPGRRARGGAVVPASPLASSPPSEAVRSSGASRLPGGSVGDAPGAGSAAAAAAAGAYEVERDERTPRRRPISRGDPAIGARSASRGVGGSGARNRELRRARGRRWPGAGPLWYRPPAMTGQRLVGRAGAMIIVGAGAGRERAVR